jgi:hypothetical protein
MKKKVSVSHTQQKEIKAQSLARERDTKYANLASFRFQQMSDLIFSLFSFADHSNNSHKHLLDNPIDTCNTSIHLALEFTAYQIVL